MWAISAPFDQLLGEKKSTCTPLQNPSANQSTNRGTQGTDINHGSSTTKIVFKRPLNSSETAATLTSLLQPFWSATTGTWHKGFQWFGNDTFWASSQPLRAGTGFYLASFVRKTKQSSNSSAPKKLLTPLPPSTHRTPRNGMHIPIPGLHRKLNPLRNKEKTVQLLSSTQSSGGVNDKAQHHTPWLDTLPNHRTSALLHKLAAGGQIHPLLKSGGHN